MILTFTGNPAIDVTYHLEGPLVPGAVHRPHTVTRMPGGKGVNVARVLHQLGEPVHAVGPGDATFAGLVSGLGIGCDFPDLLETVRSTLVVDAAETTSLWEPGASVRPGAEDVLVDLVRTRVAGAGVLVVSGSLAPGLPADLPVRLAGLAAEAGVPALLDLDGEPLAAAAAAGGAILTPNESELAGLVGVAPDTDSDIDSDTDPEDAVRSLSVRTGAPVVLTRGERGLLAVIGDQVVRVPAAARVPGNPTGAGDATAAGLARGLARGWEWPRTLREAAALGAAAVAMPYAGAIDPHTYRNQLDETED